MFFLSWLKTPAVTRDIEETDRVSPIELKRDEEVDKDEQFSESSKTSTIAEINTPIIEAESILPNKVRRLNFW